MYVTEGSPPGPHQVNSKAVPRTQGPCSIIIIITMGTGSFPGVKRSARGVDHPPSSSTEVEGRVELYLYSPSGTSWHVLGRILTYHYYYYYHYYYCYSWHSLRTSPQPLLKTVLHRVRSSASFGLQHPLVPLSSSDSCLRLFLVSRHFYPSWCCMYRASSYNRYINQ